MSNNTYFKVFTVVVMVFISTTFSQAQIYWDGGASTSNWEDADNWSTDAVPVASDSVVLDHSLISGNYTVTLSSSASVKSLSIYPSSPGDSIVMEITSNVLSVTGTGYNALAIGDRGRLNNRAVLTISDVDNFGMLLDVGGYYYHGTSTDDNLILRKLDARTNSTFEMDKPGSSLFIFPVSVDIDSLVFYNLKLSGNSGPSAGTYGVTLANDWDLIINGDLIVDNAALGLIRGDATQFNRSVKFRGNIISVNTTKTSWPDMMHGTAGPITLGWNAIFEGTSQQTITGSINFLDRVTINNPHGVIVNNNFNVLEISPSFFPNNPGLTLSQGILETVGSGVIDVKISNPSKIDGYAAAGSITSASYINGVLRRTITGSGAYDFPVGTQGNYQLLSVAPNAVTGTTALDVTFETTNLGTVPTELDDNGTFYNSLVNAGYWNVVPNTIPLTGTFDINAYETGFTFGGGNITLATRPDINTAWSPEGTHVSGSINATLAQASRTGLTQVSQIALVNGWDEPTDLGIYYENYTPGIPVDNDTMYYDFTLHNYGPTDLYAGDTVYFSAKLNGQYFGMNLMGTHTPYILLNDLLTGDSVSLNPGYLLSDMVLNYFGTDSVDICTVVWGKGIAAVDLVNSTFPMDTDGSNNTTCVTYDPRINQFDFEVSYDNYISGSSHNIDTFYLDFTLTNHGPGNLYAGDTVYLSSRMNGQIYGLNLMGTHSPHILSADLLAGESKQINPGFLLPATLMPMFPGASTLEMCVIVWGKGLASVDVANVSFPGDTDDSNNTTCVTYDPSLLSIKPLEQQNIAVYPNPATDAVTFDFGTSGNYKVQITNTLGQIVSLVTITGEVNKTINISSLDAGLYQYSIFDANGQRSAVGKFIKQ